MTYDATRFGGTVGPPLYALTLEEFVQLVARTYDLPSRLLGPLLFGPEHPCSRSGCRGDTGSPDMYWCSEACQEAAASYHQPPVILGARPSHTWVDEPHYFLDGGV